MKHMLLILMFVASPAFGAAPPRATALKEKDLKVLKGLDAVGKCTGRSIEHEQSFRLSAPGTKHDGAIFLAVKCNDDRMRSHFAEFRNGSFFQVLPEHPANEWSAFETMGLAFRDVNEDGAFDIVAIVSAITGIGPDGAKPFNVAGVYLGSKDGTWTLDMAASDAANELKDPDLGSVLPALRKHYGQATTPTKTTKTKTKKTSK